MISEMHVQTIGALVSLVGVGIVLGVAAFVYRHSGAALPAQEVKEGLYRIRKYVFVVLLLALISVLVWVWPKTPYMSDHQAMQADRTIDIVGMKWNWSADGTIFTTDDPLKIEAGSIEFRVTSADVNHGFGLYDSTGTLIAQTQAMPEKMNTLMVDMRPGVYHLYCLEYCDVGHHEMVADIVVAVRP